MTHVFPRVLDRALPTAVARGGRVDHRRATAGGTSTAPAARSSSNVGHGDAALVEAADRAARAARSTSTATMFTTEALEAYADEVAGAAAHGRCPDLPGVGRERGRRDGAQARPRVPPRARRGRARRRVIAPARPRTTGTRSARSTSAARSRCGGPTRRGSGGSCTRPPRTSTGARTRSIRTAAAPGTPASSTAMIAARRPETVAAFIAEPVAGATLGGRGAVATTTGRRSPRCAAATACW